MNLKSTCENGYSLFFRTSADRKRRLFRTELDNYRASKRSSDNLTTNFASKNIENFQSVQKFDLKDQINHYTTPQFV